MYPPCVKITVTMRNTNPFKVSVKVKGCSTENDLDMDISFPLGNLIFWVYVVTGT